MQYKFINNKRISEDSGKLILTEPVILFPETIQTIATHIVSSDETCRIDLISSLYYNNPNFSELILKFNNISNPFSITDGDILNIPDHKASLLSWKSIKTEGSDTSVKDQFMDTKRLTVKDANRVAYLKKKASLKANGSTQILPPNILKDGDSNMNIDGDVITI